MPQSEYILSSHPLYTANGPCIEYFPKGSYLIGVCAEGNTPAVVYWAPERVTETAEVELYLVTNGYQLKMDPYHSTSKPVSPQRLRYLGSAIIDNGTETVHVFEVQPERSYPFDASV